MKPSSTTAGAQVAPARVLPVIVLSQFAGTSLWFAVNAVMPDLQRAWALDAAAVGWLTSAVQGGFIAGTLVFALLSVADRWPARYVFLACALLGALCNAWGAWGSDEFGALVMLRFLTGFFLAGIYPVGMKVAASWYPQGLGAALGWLVGALVLGTAAPHLLRALGTEWPWQAAMGAVSLLAVAGGAAMALLVPEGPHLPRASGLQWRALSSIWRDERVRASAFGYFGHMWELYTFWVLVPAIVATRLAGAGVSLASFGVIAIGMLGCVGGGWLARRAGSARVAAVQLAVSGACCLLAPMMLDAPAALFAVWLAVWGITVVGDSPQFSTLTAQNAPREGVGSVLTLVNCAGFAVSIGSIVAFSALAARFPLGAVLPWLAVGPALGLLMLRPLLSRG
ncbi:MFS transporter [Schlegelella sp. S2-27]|uniref:MFS transporter n=1 Tax=Caldimonas mangrovi TaxID=2944811 RepID=A0ABT0YI83_9BURK|nr:MFS transporter [Caldimonas mangrovi]MCM5678432.1 MFS transporter [Caldimonas mangrovi]